MPDFKIGRVYHWPDRRDHRDARSTCDWLVLRGHRFLGRVYVKTTARDGELFYGELTDDEHRRCMTALLDVDAYISEHKV